MVYLKISKFIFFLIVLLGLTRLSLAQTIPAPDLDQIQRQQEHIQRQNEILRRQLELENKNRSQKNNKHIPQEELPVLPEGEQCFLAEDIIFQDVTLLRQHELDQIRAPYIGRCITLQNLDELLRSLTNLYVEKGYVTSRGFIPGQDISDGSLEIKVLEGVIEEILLDDMKPWKERRIAFALPVTSNMPLNLRDIEQGLDQLNRLQSNNAKMSLQPGTQPGGTIVKIENKTTAPYHILTSYSNAGTSATGVQQWSGTVGVDDVFGLNDYMSFSWSKDTKETHDLYEPESQSFSGFWSIPYGYLTFSGSHNFYEYGSQVTTNNGSYHSEGYSRTHKIDADLVIYRDQTQKFNSGLFIKQHTSASFINEVKLEASSYRLTSLGAYWGYENQIWSGIGSLRFSYEKGVRALAAREDPRDIARTVPHAQFDKFGLDMSFYRPLNFLGQDLQIQSSVTAQYSPETLYSVNRITLGGEYSIRGYKEETLSGDIGIYSQNTLTWKLPESGIQNFDQTFGQIRPFIGFDIGRLQTDEDDLFERGVLSGYALGVKTRGGHVNLSATYARPFHHPAHLKANESEFYVKIELSL